MKYLDRFNESDLIFFDIETAAQVKKLKKNTPLWDAWGYKCRHENEHLRKTGEELTIEDYYSLKAALYPVFGQAVVIVAGRISPDDKILNTKRYQQNPKVEHPEMAMLNEFNNDVQTILDKNPNTILVGWANAGFDQPFASKRMIVNGIRPNRLLDTAGLKPWDLPAIDLKDIWKGTGFYPDSLISVAVALGLPSPKNKMEGEQVSEAFFAGRINEIGDYCELDVLTTANIFRKFKGGELLTLKV